MRMCLVILLLLLQGCTLKTSHESTCDSAKPLLNDVEELLYFGKMSKPQREEFWDLYYALSVNCSYDSYDSEEAAKKTIEEIKKLYEEVLSGQTSK